MTSPDRQKDPPPGDDLDHFHVERRREGAVVVVRAAGDVDITTTPLLDDQLRIATALATPPAPVVADLRDVEFFGSNGISVLLHGGGELNPQVP
jgi:anti-anti-sigma factor